MPSFRHKELLECRYRMTLPYLHRKRYRTDFSFFFGSNLYRKWKHPGRYEIRYNQLQIDTMARRRLLEHSISAWRLVTKRYGEIHRRFRAHQTEFVRSHLQAWHTVAARRMQVRRLAISNWRDFGIDNVSIVVSARVSPR